MKRLILVVIFTLVTTMAHAGLWVCADGNKLRTMRGDGYALGIATLNYASIDVNCIQATHQEYDDARLQYKKLDKTVITGNRIVDWTQQEIDDYEQAIADAIVQAELDRINDLDDEVSKVNLTDITITKVDTAIDNIGSLADAKVFLKKLCRYIIANQ